MTTLEYCSVRQKLLYTRTHIIILSAGTLHWNSRYLDLCSLTRSILSWDVGNVTESVNRTDRLFIVHEAGMTRTASVGGSQCRSEAEVKFFQRSG